MPYDFRGGKTCSCVVESLPWVEFELRLRDYLAETDRVRIFQLGYRTDVNASAGTHARGGCVDINYPKDARETDIWRLWGWTQQGRILTNTPKHSHGWPYRCPHLSDAAQQQERDWDRKDAGLQGVARVQGRWPVQPWYVALKERKLSIASEIADLVADEILKPANLNKIADAVLKRDIVPNTFTGNPDNQTVATLTALGVLGARTTPKP